MADITTVTTGYFPTAKEGFTTTTSGTTTGGVSTSVGLNSVAGYANGEYVALVVDPTDATKKQVFTGQIDTTGVQVTGVKWTEGNNSTHLTGATVVDYETATAWALQRKGFRIEHNENGTHGAITATSLTSPSVNATTSLNYNSTDILGGWVAVGTVTYLSATTATFQASDVARMSVGTKVQLTQTTVKYFYVTGISGTTVTLNGGIDYTLANAAVTSPQISNASSPPSFPDYFNYTPTTFSGWSATPTTNTRFKMQGKTCTYMFQITGTSNATTASLNLPITARNTGGFSFEGWLGLLQDSGAIVINSGRMAIDPVTNANVISFFGGVSGGFTASGTKSARGTAIYEVV